MATCFFTFFQTARKRSGPRPDILHSEGMNTMVELFVQLLYRFENYIPLS